MALNLVAVYVDDLIIITETLEEMDMIKRSLESKFKMKDMGRLHYCLGISIKKDGYKNAFGYTRNNTFSTC